MEHCLLETRRTFKSLNGKIAKAIFRRYRKPELNLSPMKKVGMGSPVIRMERITKSFPGVVANDRVDFEVRKGEIHGLLGENGAGKTTLMNMLYGLYQPDEGDIFVGSERVRLGSPLDAIRLGIGMVHQHFMLIPIFTVAENIALGLRSSGTFLDFDRIKETIDELSLKYGLRADPKAKVWQLSVGEQQRVEIIKALARGADLLILDEPTSVLTPQEVRDLFIVLQSMAKEGLSVIFITHKLDEVLSISDRITVLRDGKVVSLAETAKTNKKELAKMMVGRPVFFELSKPPCEKGDVVLRVDNLWALNDMGLDALRGVSFNVCKGELLGIAGVSGNGQRELIEVIMGLRRATRGKVFVNNTDVTNHSPGEMIGQKVAYTPEDRMTDGLILNFTVAGNLILKNFASRPLSNRGLFVEKEIHSYADDLISTFGIKTPSRDTPTKNLSGGNLQKLLLARELSQDPRLLVTAQPTKGLDVGASEYIHEELIRQRGRGTAILLVSEDLDELLALSDRIAVMYEGKVTGLVEREKVNIEEIGLLMTGPKRL